MKSKAILGFGILISTLMFTSCAGGNDGCVERYMEEGLTESEAVDKCDEELVETVEVLK